MHGRRLRDDALALSLGTDLVPGQRALPGRRGTRRRREYRRCIRRHRGNPSRRGLDDAHVSRLRLPVLRQRDGQPWARRAVRARRRRLPTSARCYGVYSSSPFDPGNSVHWSCDGGELWLEAEPSGASSLRTGRSATVRSITTPLSSRTRQTPSSVAACPASRERRTGHGCLTLWPRLWPVAWNGFQPRHHASRW
jgi:hypothetical protein